MLLLTSVKLLLLHQEINLMLNFGAPLLKLFLIVFQVNLIRKQLVFQLPEPSSDVTGGA